MFHKLYEMAGRNKISIHGRYYHIKMMINLSYYLLLLVVMRLGYDISVSRPVMVIIFSAILNSSLRDNFLFLFYLLMKQL